MYGRVRVDVLRLLYQVATLATEWIRRWPQRGRAAAGASVADGVASANFLLLVGFWGGHMDYRGIHSFIGRLHVPRVALRRDSLRWVPPLDAPAFTALRPVGVTPSSLRRAARGTIHRTTLFSAHVGYTVDPRHVHKYRTVRRPNRKTSVPRFSGQRPALAACSSSGRRPARGRARPRGS